MGYNIVHPKDVCKDVLFNTVCQSRCEAKALGSWYNRDTNQMQWEGTVNLLDAARGLRASLIILRIVG